MFVTIQLKKPSQQGRGLAVPRACSQVGGIGQSPLQPHRHPWRWFVFRKGSDLDVRPGYFCSKTSHTGAGFAFCLQPHAADLTQDITILVLSPHAHTISPQQPNPQTHHAGGALASFFPAFQPIPKHYRIAHLPSPSAAGLY